MVSKYFRGDRICNICADIFSRKDLAGYINRQFNSYNKVFITAKSDQKSPETFGKFCLKRS